MILVYLGKKVGLSNIEFFFIVIVDEDDDDFFDLLREIIEVSLCEYVCVFMYINIVVKYL